MLSVNKRWQWMKMSPTVLEIFQCGCECRWSGAVLGSTRKLPVTHVQYTWIEKVTVSVNCTHGQVRRRLLLITWTCGSSTAPVPRVPTTGHQLIFLFRFSPPLPPLGWSTSSCIGQAASIISLFGESVGNCASERPLDQHLTNLGTYCPYLAYWLHR